MRCFLDTSAIAEMKAEADAKEAAVYVKHNVVNFESAHTIEQAKENARKRFKETGKRTNHIVISAIHYDKNAEDSSRRAFKCRSVCKIERDLLTMQKMKRKLGVQSLNYLNW